MCQSIGTPILSVNRKTDSFLPENIGMSIGERIKQVRKDRSLTQGQLAQKVGMAQASLSELETGESHGTTNLASIANALDVDAYWLETGKGDKERRVAPSPPPQVTLSWISQLDAELLTYFHGTDDDGREQIMRVAESVTRVLRPTIVDNQS